MKTSGIDRLVINNASPRPTSSNPFTGLRRRAGVKRAANEPDEFSPSPRS